MNKGLTTININAHFTECELNDEDYKLIEEACISESKIRKHKYYEDPLSGEKVFFIGLVIEMFMRLGYEGSENFINSFKKDKDLPF